MHSSSNLPAVRLRRARQNLYNPLPSLSDPALLARKLDAFAAGYPKEVVNIWDSLEQRDDLIRAVVSKRTKAVGRQGWTAVIRPAEGRAERGGFMLLCSEMMDTIHKRFSVRKSFGPPPVCPLCLWFSLLTDVNATRGGHFVAFSEQIRIPNSAIQSARLSSQS